MNTREIERFVHDDRICRGIFQGVYSIDTLPDEPRLLVCNTDPARKPGRHWVAIYVDSRGRGEFFDSFGRKPFDLFQNYMNEHCVDWTFNAKQLQSVVSDYCGFYCCFYCMLRCRGFDLTRIVNLFTKDTGFNDSIVHGFVCCDGISSPFSEFPKVQFLRSQHPTERKTEPRWNA
jgi:hypothetical protein